MALDLDAYKPDPDTLGDANQVANGFTAIENEVNDLPLANIAQGGATDGQAMIWDTDTGTWIPQLAGPGAPVTALPVSPFDGQQALLVDSATAPTYQLLCQWETSIEDGATDYKWLVLSGYIRREHSGSTSSASGNGVYEDEADLFTFPYAGIYLVELQGKCGGNASATSSKIAVGINAQTLVIEAPNTFSGVPLVNSDEFTVAAADVLDLYHADNDSTRRITFSEVAVKITPRRLAPL